MYDVFYIESPLQLLSAMSALKSFDSNKSILIVELSGGKKERNDRQILDLIDERWTEVIVKKAGKEKFKAFWFFWFLKMRFLYHKKVNNYFIGEYRSVSMHLLHAFVSPKKFVLLDDGTFTITAQKHYISKKVSPFKKSSKSKLLRLMEKESRVPNLYSFFDLDSSLLKGQINHYKVKPRKVVDLNKEEVFFFGANFYENKDMTLEDELYALSKVLGISSSYKYFYIPHRNESKEKLSYIAELGFFIKELPGPAEIFFDESDRLPFLVMSYFSTVLYSCHIRFSNVKICSVNIEPFIKRENTRLNAEQVYSYYDDLGFETIKVER